MILLMNELMNEGQRCLQNSPGYTGSVNKCRVELIGDLEMQYLGDEDVPGHDDDTPGQDTPSDPGNGDIYTLLLDE